MAKQNDALKSRLAHSHEINIGVTAESRDDTISNPVWFVLTYTFTFAQGSHTQWYNKRA